MPRPDRSRERLVSAAALLLRQRGYAATSTTDVLRLSGTTTGSLYHHFPGGKEDLAIAALELSAQTVRDNLQHALETANSTTAALQRWLTRLADALDADPGDGCPIAPSALEAAHASQRLRRAAAAAFEQWTATIAYGLQREGWPVAEARSTAVAVLALVEGALLLSRTARSREAFTAAIAYTARLTTRT